MPETLLTILKYAWGPFIGAVIGYFTNYIAVKMLFHPYKPWRIGKFTVPFTPGIMPKRHPMLAKAIGDAVGNHLFTGDDIKNTLLSKETKEKMVEVILKSLDLADTLDEGKDAKTANSLALGYLSEIQWQTAKSKCVGFMTDRIVSAAEEMDIGKIIAERAAVVINEKKSALGLLSLLINEGTISVFLPDIAKKINEYIAENGREMVYGAVEKQVAEYTEKPLHTVLDYTDEEHIRTIAYAAYDKLISGVGEKISEMIDIPGTVEAKVLQMSPRELEDLAMKIMKKELNSVINLGALIGFVIGIFNCVI